MKKIWIGIVVSLCTLLCTVTLQCEAKSVAVLPLINNVADIGGLEQIYLDRIFEVINKQEGLEIIDGEQLELAVTRYTKSGVAPDAEALRNISEDIAADIVLVGQLDKLAKKSRITTKEHKVNVVVRGAFSSYNKESGQYSYHKINVDRQEQEAFTSRWDIRKEEWARVVFRECNRIFNVKKLNLERPRLSKF